VLDSNQRRLDRQVYSLLPLATRATHRVNSLRVCSVSLFRVLDSLSLFASSPGTEIAELARGIEPLTSGLQNRCSAGLSYTSGLSTGSAEPVPWAGKHPVRTSGLGSHEPGFVIPPSRGLRSEPLPTEGPSPDPNAEGSLPDARKRQPDNKQARQLARRQPCAAGTPSLAGALTTTPGVVPPVPVLVKHISYRTQRHDSSEGTGCSVSIRARSVRPPSSSFSECLRPSLEHPER
jgi:hypothetical protein